MIERELTAERLRELLSYDPATGRFIWRRKMGRSRAGAVAGHTCRTTGYVKLRVGGQLYQAHRLAWLWMTGCRPVSQIDHVNMNRSDNRFENLRSATNAENNRNRRHQSNSATGFKGVSVQRNTTRYRAKIVVDGTPVHLGWHTTPEAAHAAYCDASSDLHGEYGRTS